MAGWKMEATKRIPMPEDLADGLWIEIHHPRRLPMEAVKRFLALASNTDDGKDLDVDGARDLVASLIVDWNFPDEKNQGVVLKKPADDPTVWERIPALEVINTVFAALGKGVAAAKPDPNFSTGSAST